MIAELNLFLLAVAPKGEGLASTTTEGEGGDESFSLLLEGSLMTEQTSPPDAEESATPVMVSMEEIITSLGLTEKQVSALAELIGVSVDDLGRMEITTKNPGRNSPALMPDGAYKNLAELLKLVEGGELLGKREAVTRIADMLGITKTASSELLEELGIFSFKVFSETAQPKATTAQTTQGGPPATAQGKTENSIQPSNQNSGQNANNNNNAEGETLSISLEESDGDFRKNVEGNFKAALNQTSQTTAPVAEGDGLKGAVAPASKAFQPFAQTAGMEEVNAGKQAKAVMNQIVEKASIISFPNRTRARISLSPPSLGFVNIEISMNSEGASARIVVESHAVKQVIEQNIHQLKTTFEQQGIKVEAMNVSVSEQGGNSSGSDARPREARSAFSDYTAAGGEANEENPEDDALKNERMRKKAGNHYVLDIKV